MAYLMTDEHKAKLHAARDLALERQREARSMQVREFRAWSLRASRAMMQWQENCGRLCECEYCVEHRAATSAIPKFL